MEINPFTPTWTQLGQHWIALIEGPLTALIIGLCAIRVAKIFNPRSRIK